MPLPGHGMPNLTRGCGSLKENSRAANRTARRPPRSPLTGCRRERRRRTELGSPPRAVRAPSSLASAAKASRRQRKPSESPLPRNKFCARPSEISQPPRQRATWRYGFGAAQELPQSALGEKPGSMALLTRPRTAPPAWTGCSTHAPAPAAARCGLCGHRPPAGGRPPPSRSAAAGFHPGAPAGCPSAARLVSAARPAPSFRVSLRPARPARGVATHADSVVLRRASER
mmetsp:Transcript_67435/g.188162  ORF Transcript_67435/g.188162 Transcript_67435/m.188162 type:complete len:229 (-) Transcript_67435:933-1619(-)